MIDERVFGCVRKHSGTNIVDVALAKSAATPGALAGAGIARLISKPHAAAESRCRTETELVSARIKGRNCRNIVAAGMQKW
jgi:hypothetical protein